MKCKHCSTKISEETRFCPECGKATENEESSEKKRKAKPFYARKLFWFGSLAVIFIVGMVVLYQIAAQAADPEKVIADFKEAVQTGDAGTVAHLLHPEGEGWAIDATNAEALLAYFEKKESDKQYLFDRLDEQVEILQNRGDDADRYAAQTNETPYATIMLKQEGRKWLLFPDYKLKVTPAYLNVTVNQDNAKLFLNDEEINSQTVADDATSYGPLAPGTYELEAILPARYVDANAAETVDLFDWYEESQDVALEINAGVVQASTSYEETQLYINNEETDIVLGPELTDIGTLPLDGKAKFIFEKEFPWGVATSSEISVDNETIRYEFDAMPDEEKQAVMDMLNENWEQQTDALQNGDSSKMVYASEEYRQKIDQEYDKLQNFNQEYVADFVKALYRLDSLEQPEFNSHTDRYELTVEVEYSVEEPELERFSILKDGNINRTTYEMLVYYDENEGEWRIHDFNVGYFVIVGSDAQKAYEF